MKVLCITMGQYPNNDASSQRLHLLSTLMARGGHEVKIISRNKSSSSGKVGQVTYSSSYSSPKGFVGRIRDQYIVFSRSVKAGIASFHPDVVMVISAPTFLARWIVRYREQFGYVLVHDSVEWYSKEEYAHPLLSMEFIKKQYWMKHLLPGQFAIIAISTYLEDYFHACGNDCIRIPSICESDAIEADISTLNNKLTISYAGTPGRKDRFKEIVQALLQMEPQERSRITLNVIGANAKQIAANAEVSEEKLISLGDTVVFHGKVSRSEVYKQLKQSDYTILIRPDTAIYAKAGFPTKVPESLAAGTPVICNMTSDLNLYLKLNNSIPVERCTTDAVLFALRQAINMTNEQLKDMKINARNTAESCFEYSLYQEQLNEFLLTLAKKDRNLNVTVNKCSK